MSSVIQIGIGQGVTALWGSKMSLPHYFGQWLIQQLVLPYKPGTQKVSLILDADTYVENLLHSKIVRPTGRYYLELNFKIIIEVHQEITRLGRT